MSKPGTYRCKNAEDNCPHYRDSAEITIGGVEKFVCPLGKVNCERDYLEGPLTPPDGPVAKFLKRAAIIVVPVITAGLVWLYFITRPAPPYNINVAYTSPPGAKIHPGDSVSWTFSIDGGRSTDKPVIIAESMSPLLLSKSDLRVEPVDNASRRYRLRLRLSPAKSAGR